MDMVSVVCLCAGWCGVCRDYRAVFDALEAAQGGDRASFAWIDIEDDAELLDDVDVENFPTLLIARSGRPLFYGPITPQPATLGRMVERALSGELSPTAVPPAVADLARRLHEA